AEKEKLHVKVIHSILADHNVWAKLPEAALHDGSNNWARLSGDLTVIGALAAELRIDAMKWESVDEAVAEKLLNWLSRMTIANANCASSRSSATRWRWT